MRFGTSKNVESALWCGYFLASSAACTARMETFGIGDWPARFKYVASSISNHSCRQSIWGEIGVVDTGSSFQQGSQGIKFEHSASGTTSNLGTRSGARGGLEMTAKLAEGRQDHQFSGARHDRFVFECPGVLVRDVHGVEADLHCGIDIAARAVADHPAVGLHDFVFVNQSAISLGVFFRNDFDEFEKSLQSGS